MHDRFQEAGLVEAVELHGHLIDSLQDVLRRVVEAVPLGSLDVDLHDQVLASVAVPGNLSGEGIEGTPLLHAGNGADAFAVKDGIASLAHRARQIEAVVLVHRDTERA